MPILTALFSFHGRLNRKGFWQAVGVNFAYLFVVANFVFPNATFEWQNVLPLVFLLISLYSLATVIVKRLHDRNRSGWAALMIVVPILCYGASFGAEGTMAFLLGIFLPMFISTILLMEWGLFAGNTEANAYGAQGLSLKIK